MIWLFIYIIVWGGLHSWFASLQVKAWSKKTFGTLGLRLYRVAYNIFAGISLIPLFFLYRALPDQVLYKLLLPWSILLMVAEGLAGLALVVALFQNRPMELLGICQLGSPIEEPGQLKTDGLYRFVRHPIYSAGLLLIWLLPVMTMNILAVNLGLTAYIILGAVFEEKKLHREFGQDYADYASVTPMFIPFLKRNKNRDLASMNKL